MDNQASPKQDWGVSSSHTTKAYTLLLEAIFLDVIDKITPLSCDKTQLKLKKIENTGEINNNGVVLLFSSTSLISMCV